jgi:acyl carrier protein
MNSLRVLRDCLPEGIDPNTVTSETTFASLAMDSLDLVQFVVVVEKALGVEIPNAVIKDLKTLGDVERYLANPGGV